ncbi:MAG TPA: PVC-type heme-binding CxxCH protein [Planctomycetaceae bacterium]|nr:PVC-type heme-binding CxxCH protein [Planctomycetaceae bacterium]
MRMCLRVILVPLLSVAGFASDRAAGDERVQPAFRTQTLSDVFFCEGADAGDFNRDGHMDIVSGPFWYEGPEFKKQHVYYEPKPFDPLGYSDTFFIFAEDLNGDDWTDILVLDWPGKEARWYENPQGREGMWEKHVVFDVVDNESPRFVDIDGDGRREIVCSNDGYFGFVKVNADDPTQRWTFHRVSDQSAGGRFTHGLGVGDVNGDGRLDILEKNGWWEQPDSLDGNPVWKKHPFQFSGPGGAQMYAYDFDGDGDNDVLTSLAAHGYGLAWYENIPADDGSITFRKHLILGEKPEDNRYGVVFSQLHAIDLVDMDGDGVKDIVTGKRWWAHGPKGDAEPNAAAVLYWFRTTRDDDRGLPPCANCAATARADRRAACRHVDFVPHLIHDDSGVGVEVKARDVNGDGAPDVIVGNKKGTFVSIQTRDKVSRHEWLRRQPVAREDLARPTAEGIARNEGLPPDEAAKAITVPEGFQVQLVAGEPMVHQPVAFTIDERGRLWIAEAHTYPTRAPEGQGRDNIIILEDSDGDGTFDTRKVFAEGLNLVSGLEVGFGGVWVGAAPYLMFIPDRDRDDRPDGKPEILLDGWGYQDTHETLNSFIWGPDGWLYGCHGVFTHSRVGKPGTPDDARVPINAGIWRYHPVRHEFEVFAHGTSNPWGVDFNDRGQAFATACVIPHLYHIVQGGYFQRQAGQHFSPYVYGDIQTIADHAHYAGNIRDHAWWGRNEPVADVTTDRAGGGHAHCGAMIYLGDNFPHRYRNTIFMANIHGNRINNDVLHREGSGYVGSHGPDFLFANDRWFRGINLKYGPDGGVYLIDWYDKNACHRGDSEIWDRTNGRVYKVTFGDVNRRTEFHSVRDRPDGAAPAEVAGRNDADEVELRPAAKLDLAKLNDAELIKLHAHENEWYVRTARRILQERFAALSRLTSRDGTSQTFRAGESMTGAYQLFGRMLFGHSPEGPDRPPVRLGLSTLMFPDPLPESPGASVANRLRTLWTLHVSTGVPLKWALQLLDPEQTADEYLRAWTIQLVLENRRASRQQVAESGGQQSIGEVLTKLEELAVNDPSPVVRLYLAAGLKRLPLGARWKIASGLLTHAEDASDHNIPLMIWYGVEPLVVEDTSRALALARESQIPLVSRFIIRRAASDAKGLDAVLASLGELSAEQEQLAVLNEVVGVVRNRGRLDMPAAWPDVYAKLSKSDSAEIRQRAQFITVKFGDKSIFPALRGIVGDSNADLDSRRQALDALLTGQDAGLPPILFKLLDDADLRSVAVRGLARFDHAATPKQLLSRYHSLSSDERSDAITTLATRPAYALALLDAIGRGDVPRTDLPAFTVNQLQRFGDEMITAKLNEVWGQIRSTPAEKARQIADLKKQLATSALADADLSNGRRLYKETCAKCHKLFGDGDTIGPDITGSNRADLDYILQNIIDPSAVVGRDYQMTIVATTDGRTISGLVREQNESALVLQTVNEQVVVPLEDIDERVVSDVSMMPDGQLQQMPDSDVRDLIAYLASPSQVPLPGSAPEIDEHTGRVAGAIEGESIKVLAKTGGNAQSQKMDPFTKDRWSGSDHLWWTGARPGDRLVLEVPVAESGRYELFAVMTKARDYGVAQLSLDGKTLGEPIDFYNSPDVITTGPVSLGSHELSAGPHRLTVEIVGKHTKAVPAYMFGLDYVYLAKTK